MLLHWLPPPKHWNALFLNHSLSPLRLRTERVALNSDLWLGGMMHCTTASPDSISVLSALLSCAFVRVSVVIAFYFFKILSVFQERESSLENTQERTNTVFSFCNLTLFPTDIGEMNLSSSCNVTLHSWADCPFSSQKNEITKDF